MRACGLARSSVGPANHSAYGPSTRLQLCRHRRPVASRPRPAISPGSGSARKRECEATASCESTRHRMQARRPSAERSHLQANCPRGLWPRMAASATAISDSMRASSAALEARLESNFMLVTAWISQGSCGAARGNRQTPGRRRGRALGAFFCSDADAQETIAGSGIAGEDMACGRRKPAMRSRVPRRVDLRWWVDLRSQRSNRGHVVSGVRRDRSGQSNGKRYPSIQQ